MFKGKAESGGGGNFELPPPGAIPAVLVGMIDLGTQTAAYGQEIKQVHQVFLVWELTGEPLSGTVGRNHVVGAKYTFSFHQKSNLRQCFEALEGRSYRDDEEIDYSARVASPCTVTIKHIESKTANKTYYNIDGFGPLQRGSVVKPPKIQPFLWSIGEGLMLRNPKTKAMEPAPNGDLPEWEWLPRIYGKSVHEVIRQSPEWRALTGGNTAPPPSGNAPVHGDKLPAAAGQPEIPW